MPKVVSRSVFANELDLCLLGQNSQKNLVWYGKYLGDLRWNAAALQIDKQKDTEIASSVEYEEPPLPSGRSKEQRLNSE